MGLCIGWAAPAIEQLQGNNADITNSTPASGNITENEADWIGATLPLGAIFQIMLTGILMDCMGRRCTLILSSLPMCAGWMFIYFAINTWQIYTGRLLTGFASGMYSVLCPVYIGEIASPKNRGLLGTLFQVMIVLGILLMYSLGMRVHWGNLAFIAFLVPVCTILLAMFMLPDSPTWLVSDGRVEFATEVTIWLRDRDLVLQEMEDLMDTSMSENDSTFPSPPWYRDSSKTKPIFLIFLVMALNQLCGISVVETYFHKIFNWEDTVLPASLSTTIVAITMLASTFIAGPLIQKVNRRPLLCISLAMMALSISGLGLYTYLLPPRPYNSVPLVCLFVYIAAYSMGIGPLAWVLLGDFAFPKIAPVVVTVASATNWGFAFVISSLNTSFINTIGLPGLYWMFASMSGLGTVLIYLMVPETRGLSNNQIIQMLQ